MHRALTAKQSASREFSHLKAYARERGFIQTGRFFVVVSYSLDRTAPFFIIMLCAARGD